MSYRKAALKRVFAGFYVLLVAYTLSFVLMLVAYTFAALDLLWQLVTGRDGLSSSGTVGGFIRRTYGWMFDNSMYVLLGEGDFEYLP